MKRDDQEQAEADQSRRRKEEGGLLLYVHAQVAGAGYCIASHFNGCVGRYTDGRCADSGRTRSRRGLHLTAEIRGVMRLP